MFHELTEQYAPVVYFDCSEDYYPQNVENYIRDCSLFFKTRTNDVEVEKQVNMTDLSSYSRCYQNIIHTPTRKDANRFILRAKKTTTRQGALQISDARCYTHVYRRHEKKFDIQYWFFFPYNGGRQSCLRIKDNHEGQWKCLTLRFYDNELRGIHYPGIGWKRVRDVTFVDSTHPVVYFSHWNHNMYPGQGKFKTESTCCLFSDVYDQTTQGKAWRTIESLEFLGIQIKGKHIVHPETMERFPWLIYAGLWGTTRGPAFTKYWKGNW